MSKIIRSGIIAKKVGMTQVYLKDGEVVPVTLILIKENFVLSKKHEEGSEYGALQIASVDAKPHRVSKSVQGTYKKANVDLKSKIKEFRVSSEYMMSVGDKMDVTYFKKGQYIDITANSIGKGYAGVMKRHNFKGLEASHGVSISHRSGGSTGQNQDPGRVFKGKKMAGRMGGKKVTTQNIKVIDIDEKLGLLVVKGAVPGNKMGYLYIRDAIKKHFSVDN